ncbi:Tim10/DDP family zinc finger-domain-containing protein [Tribonema minus]|uniref:Mitochondrial import inner membrane translocase subunit n=1 Tax=Tribonema minus TaxID=303371 RepID=A0A835YPH8_9STRA|nr:Tim10/DDP family zinc finger-domain-containing protein [Tribonema minus]
MATGITQEQADAFIAQTRMQAEQASMQELLSKLTSTCFTKCAKPSKGDRLDSGEQSCLALCMDRYVDTMQLVNKAVVDRQDRRG